MCLDDHTWKGQKISSNTQELYDGGGSSSLSASVFLVGGDVNEVAGGCELMLDISGFCHHISGFCLNHCSCRFCRFNCWFKHCSCSCSDTLAVMPDATGVSPYSLILTQQKHPPMHMKHNRSKPRRNTTANKKQWKPSFATSQ